MDVYTDFYSYSEGIYEHVWGDLEDSHAVIIIGWDDNDECWICKNSWDTDWGENGFFRIKWDNCDIGRQSIDMDVNPPSNLCVCPGDTNNDGIVDISDVLPIGLYWQLTGPARQNPSSLECQFVQPWTPEAATYADANGEGTIDNKDVLPIGLNWGKQSRECSPAFNPPLRQRGHSQVSSIELIGKSTQNLDTPFTFDIKANHVNGLFGIAFVLQYTNTHDIGVLTVETGDLLGNDVLFYQHIDKQRGLISIGISRKRPDVGINGSGVLAIVQFYSRMQTSSDTLKNLTIKKVNANDSSGNAIPFGISVALNRTKLMPPQTQLLQNFPNPFNPETWIPFELSSPADVIINIYDVSGQLVRRIDLGHKQSGVYTSKDMAAYWNGRNSSGEVVSSGIYLYNIQSGNFTATKKMLVVR
jgi:hypothetical protein